MGVNTIPERTDGTTIFAAWANDIRAALVGDFVPRNTNAIATDQAGSLGSTSYKWLNAFLHNLYVYNSTTRTKIQRASGGSNHDITLPNALPSVRKVMTLDENGIIAFPAVNEVVSASSGNFGTASGSFVDVTNLSCTITTLGKPVEISVLSDGTNGAGQGSVFNGTSGSFVTISVRIMRDATQIALFTLLQDPSNSIAIPSSAIRHKETVAAGTYTYKIQIKVNGGSSANLTYAVLRVEEAL